MNPLFVLDSSVTLTWCFRDERAELSESTLAGLLEGSTALVPSLWGNEVANVLVRSVRRRFLTPARASAFVEPLLSLPIDFESTTTERALRDIRKLASRAQLNAYDATFVELASRLELPLATLDEGMRKGARRLGVELVEAG